MADHTPLQHVVIGGGPAGIAAALALNEARLPVLVVNDGQRFGGQIWRHDISGPPQPRAQEWLRRVEGTNIWPMNRATVIGARTEGRSHVLTIERDGRSEELRASSVILGTGARELFLPFPGWTLPGVLGVGAAQAMAKGGLDVTGKRVVVAGTGPLLVAVAASLAKRGATIIQIVEQVSRLRMMAFGAGLVRAPRIAWDAVGYLGALGPRVFRFGSWVSSAQGDGRVRHVTITDGRVERRVDCDLLCVGYGLVPNTEIAQLLGCAVSAAGIVVDQDQQTTVPGVFAAGECIGIAGVEAALAEGAIAGHAAAGVIDGTGRYRRDRAMARAWGSRLESTFVLRPELLTAPSPETIVCRCEDVRFGDIDPLWTSRQAKLYGRVGMGPCQGRVCGPALSRLCGWDPDRVRVPIYPSFLSSLTGSHSQRDSTGAK